MNNISINLEKLTEDQLNALALIDKAAVELEKKRRIEESIYTEEEVKDYKIFSDLSKAYFFLKPMYDNMRNGDVKKTITASEILPVLEKVFRFAKAKDIKYVPYTPVAEEAPAEAPAKVPAEALAEEVVQTASTPQPAPQPQPQPMPQAAPVIHNVAPVIPPVPSASPRPIVQPIPVSASVPSANSPTVPPMPIQPKIDVEHMSVEEINQVMSQIPVIGQPL